MPRSISPPASSSQNIQCRRTRSTAAHMIRSARDAGWLAAGNAVSLQSVTQNPPRSHRAVRMRRGDAPRQSPAAFLAGLILPHQEMPGGSMSKFRPVSSHLTSRLPRVCRSSSLPSPHARINDCRRRLVHPAPPDHPLPARTGRPPGHLRGLPRSGPDRVHPLLPVRPARPARSGAARRRRRARLLRDQGHRRGRQPVALQVQALAGPRGAYRAAGPAAHLPARPRPLRVAVCGYARPRPPGRGADRLRAAGTAPAA